MTNKARLCFDATGDLPYHTLQGSAALPPDFLQ